MLYGCECGFARKSNYWTTFVEIRFFWITISTMKCSGVPFTHIYEWKRHSPSSGSSGSSGWIFLVPIVAVGYASMICFLLLFYELDSDSRLSSFSLRYP
jgi:hypothetical protein